MRTTTYSRSEVQVCQGHSTTCTACLDPEWDGCDGHGVVSYCDGTCAEALGQWEDYIGDAPWTRSPEPDADRITVELRACDGSACWVASFEGPEAQAWALAYVRTRLSTHVINVLYRTPLHGRYAELAELLHPTCEHGMSEELCMGPDHFMSYDQERALFG